ncbi:hypothetical protein [Mangrovicoccus algicola]|uniref:Uncharacterized protein n=1 Tax=Mangrovicoccus algicola TaxID=2771008 RepID=A0A8J6Z744_9RHOB|nr:hypothetical protein [Mangrovicoccus algicola]MBE3637685.1 hypothetical protein [Mangrovicoccus algicola]
MRAHVLSVLMLLAACGTAQERCERGLSREERHLDALIEETRQNLARGYAYQTETRDVSVGLSFCGRSGYYGHLGWCFDNYPNTYERRVAVDPESERRKLDSLLLKREQLGGSSCSAQGRPVAVSAPAR